MRLYIDLHCHTTASDGKLEPKELVSLALKKKLKAIAITDHDTISGIDEAVKAAKGKNIEIIPGVEISCDDPGFIDTHILGLFIGHRSKAIASMLKESRKYRIGPQRSRLIKKFRGIAKNKGLLESGGSDFHANKDEVLGKFKIPYLILEKLKKSSSGQK